MSLPAEGTYCRSLLPEGTLPKSAGKPGLITYEEISRIEFSTNRGLVI